VHITPVYFCLILPAVWNCLVLQAFNFALVKSVDISPVEYFGFTSI